MNRVPVVFCFDENYIDQAISTMGSLFMSTPTSSLRVYAVVSPIAKSAMEAYNSLQKIPSDVDFRIVVTDIPLRGAIPYDYHFNESTFLRLLLPDLIQEDRVIYFDSDIAFMKDIRPLYEVDLGGCLVAAVPEPRAIPMTIVPMKDKSKYVNAGVMLMDLKSMREENFSSRAIETYSLRRDEFTFCDQCVINYMCEGRIKHLDKKWNWTVKSHIVTDADWEAALREAAVIHFIANHKPWHGSSRSIVQEFWHEHLQKIKCTVYGGNGI